MDASARGIVQHCKIGFQSWFWTMPHYCSNTPRRGLRYCSKRHHQIHFANWQKWHHKCKENLFSLVFLTMMISFFIRLIPLLYFLKLYYVWFPISLHPFKVLLSRNLKIKWNENGTTSVIIFFWENQVFQCHDRWRWNDSGSAKISKIITFQCLTDSPSELAN